MIEENSFETFHLVDELLLSADIVANPQGAVEGESGLWTLEQVLCYAPELVGNGRLIFTYLSYFNVNF